MGNPHNVSTPIVPVAHATRNPVAQPLLTEAAAARLLGVSPQYLVKWRFLGRPVLPFVRVGKRMIRYRQSDLDAFIRSRVVAPTAPHPRYDAVRPST